MKGITAIVAMIALLTVWTITNAQGRFRNLRQIVSRQLRLFLRCCGNATTPLLTPALNSRRRHHL
jgi:hypothetical protein